MLPNLADHNQAALPAARTVVVFFIRSFRILVVSF